MSFWSERGFWKVHNSKSGAAQGRCEPPFVYFSDQPNILGQTSQTGVARQMGCVAALPSLGCYSNERAQPGTPLLIGLARQAENPLEIGGATEPANFYPLCFPEPARRACWECYAIYAPTGSSYLRFKNTPSLSPPTLSMIFEVNAFEADRLSLLAEPPFLSGECLRHAAACTLRLIMSSRAA